MVNPADAARAKLFSTMHQELMALCDAEREHRKRMDAEIDRVGYDSITYRNLRMDQMLSHGKSEGFYAADELLRRIIYPMPAAFRPSPAQESGPGERPDDTIGG